MTARSKSGKVAQAFFTVNVTNTPPDMPALADETNLSVGQGDEFDLNLGAGLPHDKNSSLDCTAVHWSLVGADSLVTEAGSSRGCNATAVFSEQGTRTVNVTITDPQELSSERTFNLTVGAPPAVKSPQIGFITVNGGAFKPGDMARVTPDSKPQLTAFIEVKNPDNVPVSFFWKLVNVNSSGDTILESNEGTNPFTINVGATADFYDPFDFLHLPDTICLNGDEASKGYDEAVFEFYLNAGGRTRMKTFNFRCEFYDPTPH